MDNQHFIYILECKDGTFYTGYTTDVARRLSMHSRGKGAKYTRSRLPVSLVYTEEAASHSSGLRRELDIKSMTRMEKQTLVSNWTREHDGT
ncbi:MAG: hypothetical protein A2201_08260 [Alicyclobacillus sp. RIFOXYA1_FULL_53_8]|nr:MAG: hypothetical protein A2201_08260 [Alicyclobacillus sp. RIFOXYA1_FULL_53_8]